MDIQYGCFSGVMMIINLKNIGSTVLSMSAMQRKQQKQYIMKRFYVVCDRKEACKEPSLRQTNKDCCGTSGVDCVSWTDIEAAWNASLWRSSLT